MRLLRGEFPATPRSLWPVAISYKGLILDTAYRIDIIAAGVLIELKAVERLLPLHLAQVVTYMKLSSIPTALLVNFNVTSLKQGLRRLALPPQHP
jgi:GxxExxY protein